jgi:hypothetical protein
MRLRFRRRAGDDAGMTAVVVALLLSVVLMFAAFALDGGTAYVAHRSSQNASDSGAMAGARALEQLKFFGSCSAVPKPVPCTSFTTLADLRTEIQREARASGADATDPGVSCWLLDENRNRLGPELCQSGATPDGIPNLASGVEVRGRQTNRTYFAGVAGVKETEANTVAKAFIYNFAGGTAAPFITCGVRATKLSTFTDPDPNAWSFDLLAPSAGGYTIQPGAVGKYYELQDSDTPGCGADSATFKGLGDSTQKIAVVPGNYNITPGNANSNNAEITVAGIQACPPGTNQIYSGCGMLIPVADNAAGSGQSIDVHLVSWLAWQVWGSGNSYQFSGNNSDPLGTSCKNPISYRNFNGKYCGKLLGAVSVTGGAGNGAATRGQPHVLKLTE